MTITLPDDMQEMVQAQASAAGYESVDEYVADVIWANAAIELDDETRAEWLALAEEARKSPLIPDPRGFLNSLLSKYSKE